MAADRRRPPDGLRALRVGGASSCSRDCPGVVFEGALGRRRPGRLHGHPAARAARRQASGSSSSATSTRPAWARASAPLMLGRASLDRARAIHAAGAPGAARLRLADHGRWPVARTRPTCCVRHGLGVEPPQLPDGRRPEDAPPDPQLPDDLSGRRRSTRDCRGARVAHNAAFADYPERHRRRRGVLARLHGRRGPHPPRPSRSWLRDPERAAGSRLRLRPRVRRCRRPAGRAARSYVAYVGTLPAHRGRGLATALLAHALHASRAAGLRHRRASTSTPRTRRGRWASTSGPASACATARTTTALEEAAGRRQTRWRPPGPRARACRAREQLVLVVPPLLPLRPHLLAVAGDPASQPHVAAAPRPTPASPTRSAIAGGPRPDALETSSPPGDDGVRLGPARRRASPSAATADGAPAASGREQPRRRWPPSPGRPRHPSQQLVGVHDTAARDDGRDARGQRGLARPRRARRRRPAARSPSVGGRRSTRVSDLAATSSDRRVRRHGRSRGRTAPPR